MSLRKVIIGRRSENIGLEVTWDDCIDLFIQSQNHGEGSSSIISGSGKGSSKKGLGGSTVNYFTMPPASH
jgi:hypothetical protein